MNIDISNLPTPTVAGEEEVLTKYGKRVFWRNYYMPDGRKEPFLLLQGTVIPVIAMPVTESGNIVLVYQFRYGVNEFILEFPGGCIEPGESAEDAVRAELDQEIGYSCGKIIPLGNSLSLDPASLGTKFLPYLVTGCAYKHEPKLDKNEILKVVEVPPAELFKEIGTGKLGVDSKTLAVLFLALPHLGYEFTKK